MAPKEKRIMRMIKPMLSLFLLFLCTYATSQSTSVVQVSFVPTYKETLILLDESTDEGLLLGDLSIETLRFYISGIALYQGEESVFTLVNSFHLIDAAAPSSLAIQFEVPESLAYTHIQFNIGIDSLTNVSGALGGDLDPTKGMYWTWQSGYINFKLEGVAERSPARHHRFQFHIGGYQAPFESVQTVKLGLKNKEAIDIQVAIDKWLASIDLGETYQIMSPNATAMKMAQRLPLIYSIKK